MTRWTVICHDTDTDDIGDSMLMFTVDGPDDKYAVHAAMLDMPNIGTIIDIRETESLLSLVMDLDSDHADYVVAQKAP